MAINSFHLLGDDDKDDPSELMGIHKKKAEEKALEDAKAKEVAKEASKKARIQANEEAKLRAEEARKAKEEAKRKAERKAAWDKRKAEKKEAQKKSAADPNTPLPSLQSNGKERTTKSTTVPPSRGQGDGNFGNVTGFTGYYKGDRVFNKANGGGGGFYDGRRNQYHYGKRNEDVGEYNQSRRQFNYQNGNYNGNYGGGNERSRGRNTQSGNGNGSVRGGSQQPPNGQVAECPPNGQVDPKSENGSVAGSQNGSENANMVDADGYEVPKRRHLIRAARRNEQTSIAGADDTSVKETSEEVSAQEPVAIPKPEGVLIPEKEMEKDESAGSEANKEKVEANKEKVEEEKKLMTLSEYEKILEEKRKTLLKLKTAEQRKVHINDELESMRRLSLKKQEEEIFIKLGSGKESGIRKDDVNHKDEKVKKVLQGKVQGSARDGGKREAAKPGDGKSKKITIYDVLPVANKPYRPYRPPRPQNTEGHHGPTNSTDTSSNVNQGKDSVETNSTDSPSNERSQNKGRGDFSRTNGFQNQRSSKAAPYNGNQSGGHGNAQQLGGGNGVQKSTSPGTDGDNQAKNSSVEKTKPAPNVEDLKAFPPLK